MSATDELRRLLDERGIEWRDGDAAYTTEWRDDSGAEWSAMEWAPTLSVLVSKRTPAQAVELTLGRGKCRFEIKDNCNDSEGTCCDVWFECSGCHARFDYYADEWLMQENYCPACGRKVEK